MITPADIESKVFSISKRGYDEEEVDRYLDQIIVEMEGLIKENKSLKEQLSKAKLDTQKPASQDTSVYEVLEAAKSLMNDIAASSERRAEIILKNAELEASRITREAKENVSKYTEEGNKLLSKVETLREKYKKMLLDEVERIDYSGNDLLKEFEKSFLNSPIDITNESKPVKDEPVKTGLDVDLTKTMVIKK